MCLISRWCCWPEEPLTATATVTTVMHSSWPPGARDSGWREAAGEGGLQLPDRGGIKLGLWHRLSSGRSHFQGGLGQQRAPSNPLDGLQGLKAGSLSHIHNPHKVDVRMGVNYLLLFWRTNPPPTPSLPPSSTPARGPPSCYEIALNLALLSLCMGCALCLEGAAHFTPTGPLPTEKPFLFLTQHLSASQCPYLFISLLLIASLLQE